MNSSVCALKPNIVTTHLEANATVEVADRYASATSAMVVMDPYEAKDHMRSNATVSLNALSGKANTLIDTSASRDFLSKEYFMANGFYKDCKTASKLDIRVTSEHRISTTKVFCPSLFTIDGHELTELQFRVLPNFKS